MPCIHGVSPLCAGCAEFERTTLKARRRPDPAPQPAPVDFDARVIDLRERFLGTPLRQESEDVPSHGRAA